MMFRKGNDELRIAINDALTSIGADGTYDKIYRRWFAENSARADSRSLRGRGQTRDYKLSCN
ncbi:MAG: transporter substrate-binding domain-containing protein [Pyrinomonadaceae bacterium]